MSSFFSDTLSFFIKLFCIIILFISPLLQAQEEAEIDTNKNLYRPADDRVEDTANVDSLSSNLQINLDSLRMREQFLLDSIELREQFIRDSIAIREKFVADSIAERERILDSLNFLIAELPRLIEASLKCNTEEIMVDANQIKIVGDSMLCDYTYRKLSVEMNKPYRPWEKSLNLSDNPAKLIIDTVKNKILAIRSPLINYSYSYSNNKNIIRLHSKGMVLNSRNGKVYKEPIDSVFFNSAGQVAKVKKYIQFSKVVNNYQKGAPLYLFLKQVKQYDYKQGAGFPSMQIVNFCERKQSYDPVKICNIINLTITREGNNYRVIRENNPTNNYSDGVYLYEFDANKSLTSVSFQNNSKSEDWKYIIELNRLGYVSRYIYQKKGIVNNTLLVYYKDKPDAKFKVETISCSFDDYGVCTFQKNNMTGKSRTRDMMTMEWSTWK